MNPYPSAQHRLSFTSPLLVAFLFSLAIAPSEACLQKRSPMVAIVQVYNGNISFAPVKLNGLKFWVTS